MGEMKMRGFEIVTLSCFLLVVFILISMPVSAEEWKLKFVERDTRSDSGSYNASIEIYCNNTFQGSYSISDKNHGQQEVILSNCGYGSSIIFSFIAKSNGCSLGIHIYNIEVLKDGYSVGFTPWSISKSIDCLRVKNYSDSRFILIFPSAAVSDCSYSSGNMMNITTSPLRNAPELKIKQSDIVFNKTVYEIEDGDSVQINVTAHNTGTYNESGASIALYINDNLEETVHGVSINTGSEANLQFNKKISYGPNDRIKIEAIIIPSNITNEGIKENNRVIKYIVKSRPYFYFKNITNLYSYNHKSEEPYSSWLSSLESECSSDMSYDYSSSTADEATKAKKLARLSLCYQFFGDVEYAEKAREGLLYIGDGNWVWANRNLAGNDTDDQNYGWSTSSNPNHAADWPLIDYGLAYNWLHEWIEANHPEDLAEIRDGIARMSADLYLLAKEIHSYGEGRSIISMGDEDNEQLQYLGILGVGAMSIIDYNGQYQDLDGSPYEWLEFTRKNLFEESQTGASAPFIDIAMNDDGLYGNSYMNYYEPEFSMYLNLYKNFMYQNLTDFSMVKWYAIGVPVISLPTGPNANFVTSTYQIWGFVMDTMLLFEKGTWERIFLNKYIENVLVNNDEGYTLQADDVLETSYRGLLSYDASDSSNVDNLTIFSPSGTYNVFRSGWDRDSIYSYFKTKHDVRAGGGTSSSIDQMSFDIFAKGAYLIVDSGDPRWMSSDEKSDAFDIGHTTWLISEGGEMKNIAAPPQSQYDNVVINPSYVNYTISDNNLDFLESNIEAKKWKTVRSSATGTFSNQVNIKRIIMFPSREYFIVLDKLNSNGYHKYSMIIPLGSTEGHSGAPGYSDNYIYGNLTISGVNEEWWDYSNNHPIESEYSSVENIVWSTLTEKNSEITSSEEVDLTVHLNPTSDVTINVTGMHLGNGAENFDFYHPYVKVRQESTSVKYLTLYYPTKSTDMNPTITNIAVFGGDGNDYATKLTRGPIVDIVSISDGETITADSMATDAVVAFSRADSGELQYFFIRGGTTLSYSGHEKLSLSSEAEYALVSYDDDDKITVKIKGTGTSTITVKGLNPNSVYAVKRDGAAYSNWQRQNGDRDIAITSSLSEHTFEIYVTEAGEEPPPEEPPANGGGSHTGGSTTVCNESWSCGAWSECQSGFRSRMCSDSRNCGTTAYKPAESEKCCDRLEILVFPIEVRINNGSAISFIVTAETNCDPESVELALSGIDKEWYSIQRAPDSEDGRLRFNVSLNVPPNASGKVYIAYKPVSATASGLDYNSIIEIVTPKTAQKQVEGYNPMGEETWILIESILAVILVVAIVVLSRVYVLM